MTGRKILDDVKTGGSVHPPGEALGLHAYCRSGVGSIDGVNSVQAHAWNFANLLALMQRKPSKGKPPEDTSTDAGRRGGVVCSSDYGPVMGLERRDHITLLKEMVNLRLGRNH